MGDQDNSAPEGRPSPACDGLQLWRPYDALQCCEPNQATLQVTPWENGQEETLPQIYYSQVHKEVLPERRSLQLPELHLIAPHPAGLHRGRLHKRVWKIASMVAVVVGAVVAIVFAVFKIRQSDGRHASNKPTSLMTGSPIVPILSIGNPTTGLRHDGQASSVFFQAIRGFVGQVTDMGLNTTTWRYAGNILTDAINNTGLTAFSYRNGSYPRQYRARDGLDSKQ
ncbi:MAG: hypothetical protein Q9187_007372 [Circinaria calcarea]